MKAKEMFEELGYTLREEDNKLIYEYRQYYSYNIVFKLYKRSVYKSKGVVGKDVASSITMEELKAINQQAKELGWEQ